jgi:hypothetical protein
MATSHQTETPLQRAVRAYAHLHEYGDVPAWILDDAEAMDDLWTMGIGARNERIIGQLLARSDALEDARQFLKYEDLSSLSPNRFPTPRQYDVALFMALTATTVLAVLFILNTIGIVFW